MPGLWRAGRSPPESQSGRTGTHEHQNQDLAASDRCHHCRGLLVTREDTHGRYLACVCCGRHFPDPAEDGELAGQGAPAPDTGWQPRTQRAQDRHREIGDVIENDDLDAKGACARFAISRSTYFRIKRGRRH